MNVLLVRPPSIMGREHFHAMQHPVNLCMLAAYIEPEGFRVRILDYEVNKYSPEHFMNVIRIFGPRIIGYTAMTPMIETTGRMAETAAKNSGVINVVGGAHVSILPVETLEEYPAIDAVVMGEGEKAFLELCRAVRSNSLGRNEIPSVLTNLRGTISGDRDKRMPPLDMDTLPIPSRELLEFDKYRGVPTPGITLNGSKATQLFTARGCPGRCIFCCSDQVFGRNVRSRSVGHVMSEVRDCMTRFGFSHFTIDNDTFTYDRNFVMKFCEEMSALPVTWDCDTRVDRIDADMIYAMAESGCKKIAYGVESGSEKILKLIRKGITIEQVENAFEMTRKAGIMTCAFLMVGNHPEETKEDIEKTIKLVRRIKPDLISVALSTPYPGTHLRQTMKEAGILQERPWSHFGQSFHGKPFVRTNTLSAEDLQELQSKMLRAFYLDPNYIMRRVGKMKSPRDAMYWVRAGAGFITYSLHRR